MKTIKNILDMNIGKKIKDEKIALMCNQFSVILKSGINISKCTKLVADQTDDGNLKNKLYEIYKDIEGGNPVAASFENEGNNCFPPGFVETVRAGELSGNMSESFDILSRYYKEQASVSKQIKTALIYPCFVLFVAIIVLIVVLVYVFPKLFETFSEMEGDLPGITSFLMNMSDLFSNNLLIIGVGLFLLIMVLLLTPKTKKGKLIFDRIKLKLPIPGKILIKTYQADFSRTLSMLLKSGIVLTKALKITSKVFNNSKYKNACIELSQMVESGKELGISMKKTNCFEKVLCEMTAIGEETGELETMLEVCSLYYKEEADSTVKKFLASLEPALLIFIAAFAGFIAFAVYLPLFEMYEVF